MRMGGENRGIIRYLRAVSRMNVFLLRLSLCKLYSSALRAHISAPLSAICTDVDEVAQPELRGSLIDIYASELVPGLQRLDRTHE